MTRPATDGALTIASAVMGDLALVTEHVARFCASAGLDDDVASSVRLVTEEAFTNVVRHGYRERGGPVRLELTRSPDRVEIVLADDAPTFDPASLASPDVGAAADDRVPGGLGWHLIRSTMDEVHHVAGAQGGGNVLTLVKHLSR